MKFEEVIVNGEKVKITVDIDDKLYEDIYVEEKNDKTDLDDTTDLSKTIEFIIGENHE